MSVCLTYLSIFMFDLINHIYLQVTNRKDNCRHLHCRDFKAGAAAIVRQNQQDPGTEQPSSGSFGE